MLDIIGRTARSAALVAVAMAAGVMLLGDDAEAQSYGASDHHGRPSYVVALSQWGNGTVSGAVRPGRHGLQVRLPRGTWVDCVRTCSDTLRRESIDFWQSHGHNAPGSGRGYLNWQFRY